MALRLLNIEFLERIATARLGWETHVRGAGASLGTSVGILRYTMAGHWEIRLRWDLLTRHPERLGQTFFHEVAHGALGHLERVGKFPGYATTPAEIRERWPGEVGEFVVKWAQGQEDEADAWADRMLVAVEAVCKAQGMSFLDLAIIEGGRHADSSTESSSAGEVGTGGRDESAPGR